MHTTPIRILVVDDDENNRYLLQLIFDEAGFVVETASSGEEAIEKIKQQVFHVVLMDLRMAGIDGLEATRIIRREVSAHLPILAVSAHVLESVKEECLAVGMNAFIKKPIDIDKAKDEIAAWGRKYLKRNP